MKATLLYRPMLRSPEILGAILLALITALLAVAASAPAGAVAAPQSRTVSNVATIEWDFGGNHLVIPSNQVDLTVTIPAEIVEMKIYRLTSLGSSLTATLTGTSCQSSSGPVPTSFDGVFAGIDPAATPIQPASEIRAGEPLVIEIDRPSSNVNPAVADMTSVVVSSSRS